MVRSRSDIWGYICPCCTASQYFPKYRLRLTVPVVLLAKDPIVEKYDLSSIRIINSSAAPLKEDLLLATYRRLGIPIKQGYGLTETSPMVRSGIFGFLIAGYYSTVGRLETRWYETPLSPPLTTRKYWQSRRFNGIQNHRCRGK